MRSGRPWRYPWANLRLKLDKEGPLLRAGVVLLYCDWVPAVPTLGRGAVGSVFGDANITCIPFIVLAPKLSF